MCACASAHGHVQSVYQIIIPCRFLSFSHWSLIKPRLIRVEMPFLLINPFEEPKTCSRLNLNLDQASDSVFPRWPGGFKPGLGPEDPEDEDFEDEVDEEEESSEQQQPARGRKAGKNKEPKAKAKNKPKKTKDEADKSGRKRVPASEGGRSITTTKYNHRYYESMPVPHLRLNVFDNCDRCDRVESIPSISDSAFVNINRHDKPSVAMTWLYLHAVLD